MEVVSTSFKRLFLRVLKSDAAAQSITLLANLTAYATAQVKATKGGVTLVSSSGNGQSFGLLPNGGDGLTPLSYGELISDLMDRYDTAVAWLGEEGVGSPTDTQIYDRMMSVLLPVTETRSDFQGLRI